LGIDRHWVWFVFLEEERLRLDDPLGLVYLF